MDLAYWCKIGLLIVILKHCIAHGFDHDHVTGVAGEIQYSRDFLLLIRDRLPTDHAAVVNSIPNYLRTNPKKWTVRTKRKWGSKAGIRRRLRKLKNKLSLPVTLLINAQSLKSKTDELTANIHYLHEYRSACVMAITETWLDSGITSSEVGPLGFSVFRTDRDTTITKKTRGGGVCLLIRDEWCCTVVVRESLCTPDIELLCLSSSLLSAQRVPSDIFYCRIYSPKGKFRQITWNNFSFLPQAWSTVSRCS